MTKVLTSACFFRNNLQEVHLSSNVLLRANHRKLANVTNNMIIQSIRYHWRCRQHRSVCFVSQAGVKGLDTMAEVAFAEDSRFNLTKFVTSGASKVKYSP